MPTAGRTDTSANNFWQQNTGTNNQYGSAVTMSESGLIQYLDVYCAADTSSCAAVLCLWDSSGNLLAQSNSFTLGVGSTGINNQAWQRQALSTPYAASAGTYYVGFWRATTGTVDWSYLNSGGTIHPAVGSATTNVSSPSALSTGTSTTGQMSAYVEYVKGGLALAASGSFVKHPLNRWNGSAWQRHPLKRWSGSAWNWYA